MSVRVKLKTKKQTDLFWIYVLLCNLKEKFDI